MTESFETYLIQETLFRLSSTVYAASAGGQDIFGLHRTFIYEGERRRLLVLCSK